jgi:hypothetical protein
LLQTADKSKVFLGFRDYYGKTSTQFFSKKRFIQPTTEEEKRIFEKCISQKTLMKLSLK